MNPGINKGQLKVGKKRKKNFLDVAVGNILNKSRPRISPPVKSSTPPGQSRNSNRVNGSPALSTSPPVQKAVKGKSKMAKKSKGNARIGVGDMVSLPATAFDGDEPGSYSKDNPGPCFGKVLVKEVNGMVEVEWLDGSKDKVKLRDLKLEARKKSLDAVVSRIIVLMVEGEQVAFESKEKTDWPKNFFEVLVRKDWRSWVQAVKKELTGWDSNNAVTVVDIKDVPRNAKVVPLGELYTIKRDGTHKFRQYLMGNLLREGVDFGETFSTTVSNTGICLFYSLATSCDKEVWGWDAICGYLQCKEQYDVFAFLPSHHEYSSLEYEDIALMRKEFLRLVEDRGEEGLKQFARKHKRDGRCNPKQVYKCNSSIYGAPSAGHEFEMLMHSVHTKACGLTQTQPEPSLYVRIVVDEDNVVEGYLIVAIYVDDVRFFGTTREREKYLREARGKIKLTIEKPPISEFVSIETYQDLKTQTCELKMPTYWRKAANGYASLFKDGKMKVRTVPLTAYDEKLLKEVPTEEEIKEARYLPYAPLLGVMTYPASNCKFEIKLAISKLGSRRNGWSKKHFEVVLRVFEYAVATCEIGLMYSKGIDPRGENVLYAYADASLEIPRPYGCRIVMCNGAAILFKAKKQTVTAPSTTWAELVTFSDCSLDVRGCRNLICELGFPQEEPTPIAQDNQSAQTIVNNRGSLGQTSRAMDLKVLSSRNRIEDHEVVTEDTRTDEMIADMGTKALTENPFVRYRDIMNGYSLVKAAYPDKKMSEYVYEGGSGQSLQMLQARIMVMSVDAEDVY